MLCMNTYPKTYIDECRANIAHQVSAYDELVGQLPDAHKSAARKKTGIL